ncbi:MAG: hypothetical protein V8R50_01540 [Clostridia bacterium]
MKNETAKAVIRLIVTAMLMVKIRLTLAGKNPIPFARSAYHRISAATCASWSVYSVGVVEKQQHHQDSKAGAEL